MSSIRDTATDTQTTQLTMLANLDAARWDEIVLGHSQGHLLQRWAWGELKGQFGWQPIRIAVTNGALVAAAQLLIRRFYGLAAAYVPRGPLWSGDGQLDQYLLHVLRDTAQRQRAAFLRLEPNLLENDPAATRTALFLHANHFRIAEPLQPRSEIHLDLTPPPDQIFAAFSKNYRSNVRRAERAGMTVRVGTSADDVAVLYNMLSATASRQEFGLHGEAYYRTAWELFGRANDSHLAIAELDGEPVGAALVFASGHEAHYLYSGSTPKGMKHEVNYLLRWHNIQWAKERGCTRFSFGGIPDAYGAMLHAAPTEHERLQHEADAHPLNGVYKFKKGWGGNVVRYLPAYDQVYIGPAYWVWQRRRSGEG
jgi:lipid II:glycine glycyltransferase (peptidoglycan interpeptide bridge formation enzyme)